MDIESIINKVIEDNPKVIADVQSNPKAIGRLIGVVMKEGKNLNPKQVKSMLEEKLGAKIPEKQKKEKEETCIEWFVNKQTGEKVRIIEQYDIHPLIRSTIIDLGPKMYFFKCENGDGPYCSPQNDFNERYKRE
jgi:hypothetical protein